MASSTTEKSVCTTCKTAAGTFTCRGCIKDFCAQHVTEHREILNRQMDEIILDHHGLHEKLNQQVVESCYVSLEKRVDQWEKESIEKIHQIANELRKEITNITDQYIRKLAPPLEQIKQELDKARNDENFDEIDLKRWIETLNQFMNDLANPRTIKIRDDNSTLLTTKTIFVSEMVSDHFEQSKGQITVEPNGQVAVHSLFPITASIRGKNEYSSGNYEIRFKIEYLHQSKWIFLGIISKSAPIKIDSYTASTAYGWAGNNEVYLNGVKYCGFNGYRSDIQINDILELLIACDQQMIQLKNERTNQTHRIDINLKECPFPWQFQLCLYGPYDKVSLIMP
jgi:hypothetical protein